MLKLLAAGLFSLIASITMMPAAFAQVDVNKADQAALDGIKGIGPAKSKMILEERKKGEFKDWHDFESRVKGIGEKSAAKLSEAGLTVNGQAFMAATGKAATGKTEKPAAAGKEKMPDTKK